MTLEECTNKQLQSFPAFNINRLNTNIENKLRMIEKQAKSYGLIIELKTIDDYFEFKIKVDKLIELRQKEALKKNIAEGKSSYSRADNPNLIELFKEPTKLVIGQKYHLKWAYKGAKFQLKSFDESKGTAIVYTGKTNKKLLEVKISDFLLLRNK